MKPKIAFGFHVKELDHDSQITVDEVVQQAYSRGYQEVVLFAHTYHPTDLAPLDIKILQDVFHQDYPLPVSFAPEVNIHPEWDDGQVGGVYLDMLDFRELGIPLKSVVLSLHFTAAIFRNFPATPRTFGRWKGCTLWPSMPGKDGVCLIFSRCQWWLATRTSMLWEMNKTKHWHFTGFATS